MYDPKSTKYPYPMDTSSHYIKFKKQRNIKFDDKYPFIDKRKSHRFKCFLIRIVVRLIVFPMTRIKLGLKINGRKNLKVYKDQLSNGAITCCNHVNYWDYLGILVGIRPIKPMFLVWDKNVRGESGTLIRLIGGIPIPDNAKGMRRYYEEIGEFLNNGGFLHIYPEGSMWEYYMPIRPFKRGLSFMAIKYNKPILPMAFSYRKPSFIRKKIFHQEAVLTLNIGTPIFKNDELNGKEQEEDLTRKCHNEVVKLAGISNNIYNAIYDNSIKIEY